MPGSLAAGCRALMRSGAGSPRYCRDQFTAGGKRSSGPPKPEPQPRQPSGPRQGSSAQCPSRSIDSPHRALQKYTIYSKSSKRGETVKIPSQFRRDLTPKTRRFLNDTYFICQSNLERFKDVMKDKRCLRCGGAH